MLGWRFSVAYIVGVLSFLYWGYPFDGMVVNESWGLHFNEVREFKFFGYGSTRDVVGSVPFLYDPVVHTFDWTFLHSRRGLVPIVYWLLDRFSVGDQVVFTNILCVAVLGLNLFLFAHIAWRLAGPSRFFPILVLYSLYPFSAGIHYWQVIVVNNLAVTFLFLSLSLFLAADFTAERPIRTLMLYGIPCLCCYWLSLFNHEYALFLSPVYLYLALYYVNGRSTLWRFTHWQSPYVYLGCAVVLVGAVAFLCLIGDAPSLLLYAPRFHELAMAVHLPEWLVPPLTVVGNAALFYLSVTFSNSVGLLLYPFLTVQQNLPFVMAAPWVYLAVGLLSGLLVWGIACTVWKTGSVAKGLGFDQERRFLLVIGGAWVILSYLPFSTSIGYPRIVGLMADRVNILASGGIAMVAGVLLEASARRLRQTGLAGFVVFYGILLGTTGLLLLNLYVQREYFVEAFRKERAVAQIVLALGEETRRAGREAMILLDRPNKIVFPRTELMMALKEQDLGMRLEKILGFLFARYFREQVISTSFHLGGIYLFGCCPDSAYQTFNGYAGLWGKRPVRIYKREEPFRFAQDAESWNIGYEDTRVWSRAFGTNMLTKFPKQDYQLIVLELEDSFFVFRGEVAYRLRPFPDSTAQLLGL